MNKKQHFWIPMVISMFLLPCFLGYFLVTEYQDERSAMMLEEKDSVIDHFFAKLDTISNKSDDGNGALVTWIKGDTSSTTSFKLRVVRTEGDSDHMGPMKIFIDSLGPDTIVNVMTEIRGPVADSRFPISTTEKGQLDHLEVFALDNFHEAPDYGVVYDEITSSQILRRMLPQILFSVFLLLSVFLAYWLVHRSLRNERQLTLLRNDFMSNMSHELKTPVSTIGVALEALSSFDAGDNPALRKEYIDISKHEVERLGLLVDKALNISLYEQGRFVFDRQNIDLNTELVRVLKTLKVQLDNQNVELNFVAKGADFEINVDRTHMVNVIYNLIENAVKYSPDGAEIDISLIERTDEVELAVSDKGRGIPAEYHAKVFDKFFRVPQGNRHNVKGHGLGLSYVKEVVENLGGRIFLKSGEEAGSTFILKIPKVNG